MAAVQAPSIASAPSDQHTQLQRLVCATESSTLRPKRFFVSWSGVVVLAYSGFSPALEAFKESINASISSLPKENPGSKWPKTSLGCLKEGARLTPAQMQSLLQICREESQAFDQADNSAYDKAVMVDDLSVVLYECRSLERRLSCQLLPLLPDKSLAGPSSQEQARVAAVMAEEDAADYWFHASKDGNRANHYTANALGVTLVHDLACFSNPASQRPEQAASAWGTSIPGIVHSFRQRVELELPGLYTWFADSSLHVTVRALL